MKSIVSFLSLLLVSLGKRANGFPLTGHAATDDNRSGLSQSAYCVSWCDTNGDMSSSSDAFKLRTTREVSKRTAIPDPSDFGYVITVDTKSNAPEGWTAYRITHPDAESDPIDKFRINNRAQFTLLGISYAYNKAIDDRPGRLALRDLILGFWKFTANRNIYDLKEILYLDVEEPTLTTMTPSIYEYMGAKTGVDLTVRSGQTGDEDKAYNALLTQAPFCIGAQKMLTEYGDQFLFDTTIESFQFSFPNKQFNFQINIHSTSNS